LLPAAALNERPARGKAFTPLAIRYYLHAYGEMSMTQCVALRSQINPISPALFCINTQAVGAAAGTNGNSQFNVRTSKRSRLIPLTDFFWRDVIPTDAVRLTQIVSGTYNQSLKYKIIATTNKGDTRVIADNLSTTQNNVIDCRNAALGLRSDEYITSFTLVFGTVKAGFAQVAQPQVSVTVLNNLPNGYEFANKADVGGEWVIGNHTWVTKIFAQPTKMPRTGY